MRWMNVLLVFILGVLELMPRSRPGLVAVLYYD